MAQGMACSAQSPHSERIITQKSGCHCPAPPRARLVHTRRHAAVGSDVSSVVLSPQPVKRQSEPQMQQLLQPAPPPRPVKDEGKAPQSASGKARFKEGVVIVGGGPAGLASAMVLAKRGWTDITVVEKRQDLMVEEVDRSYVYMVDGRGHKLLSQFKGMGEAIDRYAVPLDGINLTTVKSDGNAVTRQLNIKSQGWVSRWLPRAQLIKMLHDEGLIPGCAAGWGGNITLRTGTRVSAMEREPREAGGWQVKLTLEDTVSGEQEVLRPHLVVGADGLHSMVRSTLADWEQQEQQAKGNAGEEQENRFALQQYDSPSANLKFKVLRLPPNPLLSTHEGAQPISNPSMAVVESKNGLKASRRVRLGLLPVRDSQSIRTANIIMPASGHDLMDVKDPEQLYKYLEEVCPQLPVRELIPLEEARRFASSKGGAFPYPQHVNGLQMSVPAGGQTPTTTTPGTDASVSASARAALQGYGVVLLGDARAAFPPDIGQGVNSAFEDVIEFEKALDACGDDVAKALPRYEAARLPDIKALINVMTFAYPWQYSTDLWNKTLWTINFLLRTVLNKIAPWWFSPQSFMLVQDPNLSYSQILERAHATTRRLITAALVIVAVPLALAAWPAVAPLLATAVSA